MGVNWRPVFDPLVVHRELEIIRNDLHCNAVRICGRDIDRLSRATEDAFTDGLEVWRHDLDKSSFALVKTFAEGCHGTTYPDMHWEP